MANRDAVDDETERDETRKREREREDRSFYSQVTKSVLPLFFPSPSSSSSSSSSSFSSSSSSIDAHRLVFNTVVSYSKQSSCLLLLLFLRSILIMNHENSPFVLIDNIDAESLLSKAKVRGVCSSFILPFLSFGNCRFLSTPSTSITHREKRATADVWQHVRKRERSNWRIDCTSTNNILSRSINNSSYWREWNQDKPNCVEDK